MFHYQTRVSVITIVICECTVLLLLKYGITVCDFLFGFWSYCLIFYIHLCCINIQQWATTPSSLLLPSSQVSVLCCPTKYGFKVYVILFDLYSTHLKFISIYPASSHSNEQHYHLTALASYHLTTDKWLDFIMCQPIVVRSIITRM